MALKDHEKELEYCTYCPKLCRHACPVSNALGNEALIPQAKMQTLNMLRRGDIPWRQSYVDTLYACTGCKLCQTYCEHDIDVAAILWEGRTEARSRGFVHPTLEHLPEELRQRADDLRVKLEKSHLADRLASEARVGYLPGVDAIETSMGDIDDAFFVFDRLGLDFVRLAEASVLCVAYQLWAGGFIETARHAAEELVRQLRNYATVVVGSAACA
ncbi:MAG: (Fe-S)-binding protein, partial [Deltaproteobacteria bacterium]|nr:(Fe-S)-binding protein [Deltaproteobacteria bacterium]